MLQEEAVRPACRWSGEQRRAIDLARQLVLRRRLHTKSRRASVSGLQTSLQRRQMRVSRDDDIAARRRMSLMYDYGLWIMDYGVDRREELRGRGRLPCLSTT